MPSRPPVADALRALRPADALEAGHVAAMQALLLAPGEVFAREHFDPGHFTASAFVLSPEREALLLIFHEKLQRWLQPGGHFEPQDGDLFAAARREVEEETGLGDVELVGDGLFDVDVHVIPARRQDPAHRHFDLRVLYVARHRAFVAASDALAGRWVPFAEVPTVGTDESVMRAVRKLTGG